MDNSIEMHAGNPRTLDALAQEVRYAAALRGLGLSYTAIGKQLGLAPRGVSALLRQHRRCLGNIDVATGLNGLSSRAVNTLGRLGVRTLAEAREANVLARLVTMRNCGGKTADELARWMEADSSTPVASPDGDANHHGVFQTSMPEAQPLEQNVAARL